MRLTKFFADSKGIDKKINVWVRESTQQRQIVQITPCKEGLIVLYEKRSTREKSLESLERSLRMPVKKKAIGKKLKGLN